MVLLVLGWLYASQGPRQVMAGLRDPVQAPFVAVPAITAMMLGAALAQAPAGWLMVGLAVALFGLAPRLAVPAGWTALGGVVLVTLLGPTLRLPQWVMDISPFSHVPKLPGGVFSGTPLLWLAGVAAALTVAGLAGLRRRDLG